jgi:hypothetical protein
MCGVFPTLERLAKTACLPASQKIELFSDSSERGSETRTLFFGYLVGNFPEARFWIVTRLAESQGLIHDKGSNTARSQLHFHLTDLRTS